MNTTKDYFVKQVIIEESDITVDEIDTRKRFDKRKRRHVLTRCA